MEKTPLGLQPFWKLASSEISRSRGEAIQTGLQEQQTIDEELIKILFESIPEISSKVIGNSSFKLKLYIYVTFCRYRGAPKCGKIIPN